MAGLLLLPLALAFAWLVPVARSEAVTAEGGPDLQQGEQDEGTEQCTSCGPSRSRSSTRQTLSDFEVAGVNLALWFGGEQRSVKAGDHLDVAPFELYEDFCIQDSIIGNESWYDLLGYRRLLQRPGLSFYVDKVARKRWLPTAGFEQPHWYALSYAHELTASGRQEDERDAILDLLPAGASYAAKPTHMSMTKGVWLVKHDAASGTARISSTAAEPTEDSARGAEDIAASLARQLHMKADSEGEDAESWALRSVKPGIVVEELFTETDHVHRPPVEFCVFVIWGRVWIAQMNIVVGTNRWNAGFFHRNGTRVPSGDALPSWLDWQRVLDIAERLGAHKDMFRVDLFVGLSTHAPSAKPGASMEERRAAAQYVVSESEIYPTTVFVDKEICEEGARLWIAGYKMGNYRLVPNAEVPAAFLDAGSCAPSACG